MDIAVMDDHYCLRTNESGGQRRGRKNVAMQFSINNRFHGTVWERAFAGDIGVIAGVKKLSKPSAVAMPASAASVTSPDQDRTAAAGAHLPAVAHLDLAYQRLCMRWHGSLPPTITSPTETLSASSANSTKLSYQPTIAGVHTFADLQIACRLPLRCRGQRVYSTVSRMSCVRQRRCRALLARSAYVPWFRIQSNPPLPQNANLYRHLPRFLRCRYLEQLLRSMTTSRIKGWITLANADRILKGAAPRELADLHKRIGAEILKRPQICEKQRNLPFQSAK
ncbi:uncharacterized protein EV422DRAFT_348565 [Fimicolochytrium jonesii]|uniref:uncharacterized protein n=1 Tax=Fimicolochytrium jonesii TaxID=1396493 RepID=UPI0022FE1BDB|nr:uncharacterized protein EV422DRAFT_348565 [Fimicolochytrium jonesii]KAI8815673.1 hypothetical protein EV422DRAFT_348565 [Fimicolochytrium jonesii]